MFKKITLILFFILSFSSLSAEIINKVNINGNTRVSDETIIIYGKIELNKNYTESDLNIMLKDLYSTEFFSDIKIDIKNNELNLNIKEYPYINQLVIIGEKTKNYINQIKKIIKLKEKRSFIDSYISEDVEKIKNLYFSAGYNSTKIEIKSKKLTDNSFDVLIEIDRGEKTKIKNIIFLGNKSISNRRLQDVIASQEHKFWKILTKNTNFTKNLLELDTRLLRNYYKSSGFYDVKINSKSAQLSNTGEAELTFSIDEGKRYTINIINCKIILTPSLSLQQTHIVK